MSKHVPPPTGAALDSSALSAALGQPGAETPLPDLPSVRKEASRLIEFLIDLLDATDDDVDLEEGHDTEPDVDREDGADDEPSLGSSNDYHGTGASYVHDTKYAAIDTEDQCEGGGGDEDDSGIGDNDGLLEQTGNGQGCGASGFARAVE